MKNKKNRKRFGLGMVGILGVLGAFSYQGNVVHASENTELVYCIGSVSKVYSTAAVMKLAEEGKVDLDAPVTEYIPDFKMADPRYKEITVRMLMNHTSGIMGTTLERVFLYDEVDSCHQDTLLNKLSTQRLKADPGEYASYCNDGFDLLAILVERVTGMTYTEYVEKEIAIPTGGTSTGTGYNYAELGEITPAYTPGYLEYDTGSIMCLGGGGVYSVASDVAKFGASFFTGDKRLLSEQSKKEMATKWNGTQDDLYRDENGLGWDYVSRPQYEEKDVKVLGKGGDVIMNHAFLMVAPEEKISVSVLSNGGSSSFNELLAEALMDVVLEEKGISIEEEASANMKAVDQIPKEYDAYTGCYISQGATGVVINKISFPEHKYMHVENIRPTGRTADDYVLTTDGSFASLSVDVEDLKKDGIDNVEMTNVKIASNPTLLHFEKGNEGQTYVLCDMKEILYGLGNLDRHVYAGEKIQDNPIDSSKLKQWERIDGQDLLLCNEKYSSENYDYGIACAYLNEEVPGYVFVCTGMETRLLKIVDETHAVAFTTVPCSTNRDLIDVTLKAEGESVRLILSAGLEFIKDDQIPMLTVDQKEVVFDDNEAKWFQIDDILANEEIVVERPEHSTIYVFTKFGDIIYTTHVKDASNVISLPAGGKIVFLGQKGDKIRLNP